MIEYVMYMLIIAIFIVFVRAIRGPTTPDRVLSVDTINSIVIALIVIFGIYYGNEMVIDIAIVYAMMSFLGTIAISKHVMGKEMHE